MSELNSESTSLTPSESLPVAPLSSSDSSASASKPSIMDSLNNLTKNLGTAAEKVAETTSDKISSGITQASDSVSSLTNELVAPPPLPFLHHHISLSQPTLLLLCFPGRLRHPRGLGPNSTQLLAVFHLPYARAPPGDVPGVRVHDL